MPNRDDIVNEGCAHGCPYGHFIFCELIAGPSEDFANSLAPPSPGFSKLFRSDCAAWAMNHAAETNALVFTNHFAESSAGRVSRKGDRFTWHFV